MIRLKQAVVSVIWLTAFMTIVMSQDDARTSKRKTYKHGATITTEYNKENNETKVELKQIAIIMPKLNSNHNLNITAYFTYPGKTPAKPESVIVGIISAFFDRAQKFKDLREFKAQINGESVSFGEMELVTSRPMGQFYKEVLGIAIPFESFMRIVNVTGDALDMSVGLIHFRLEKNQVEALRDLAGRVEP